MNIPLVKSLHYRSAEVDIALIFEEKKFNHSLMIITISNGFENNSVVFNKSLSSDTIIPTWVLIHPETAHLKRGRRIFFLLISFSGDNKFQKWFTEL